MTGVAGRCVAEVSDESRDGWQKFATAHHTNRTALIEVLGRRLGELPDLPEPWPTWLAEAVQEAEKNLRRRHDNPKDNP